MDALQSQLQQLHAEQQIYTQLRASTAADPAASTAADTPDASSCAASTWDSPPPADHQPAATGLRVRKRMPAAESSYSGETTPSSGAQAEMESSSTSSHGAGSPPAGSASSRPAHAADSRSGVRGLVLTPNPLFEGGPGSAEEEGEEEAEVRQQAVTPVLFAPLAADCHVTAAGAARVDGAGSSVAAAGIIAGLGFSAVADHSDGTEDSAAAAGTDAADNAAPTAATGEAGAGSGALRTQPGAAAPDAHVPASPRADEHTPRYVPPTSPFAANKALHARVAASLLDTAAVTATAARAVGSPMAGMTAADGPELAGCRAAGAAGVAAISHAAVTGGATMGILAAYHHGAAVHDMRMEDEDRVMIGTPQRPLLNCNHDPPSAPNSSQHQSTDSPAPGASTPAVPGPAGAAAAVTRDDCAAAPASPACAAPSTTAAPYDVDRAPYLGEPQQSPRSPTSQPNSARKRHRAAIGAAANTATEPDLDATWRFSRGVASPMHSPAPAVQLHGPCSTDTGVSVGQQNSTQRATFLSPKLSASLQALSAVRRAHQRTQLQQSVSVVGAAGSRREESAAARAGPVQAAQPPAAESAATGWGPDLPHAEPPMVRAAPSTAPPPARPMTAATAAQAPFPAAAAPPACMPQAVHMTGEPSASTLPHPALHHPPRSSSVRSSAVFVDPSKLSDQEVAAASAAITGRILQQVSSLAQYLGSVRHSLGETQQPATSSVSHSMHAHVDSTAAAESSSGLQQAPGSPAGRRSSVMDVHGCGGSVPSTPNGGPHGGPAAGPTQPAAAGAGTPLGAAFSRLKSELQGLRAMSPRPVADAAAPHSIRSSDWASASYDSHSMRAALPADVTVTAAGREPVPQLSPAQEGRVLAAALLHSAASPLPRSTRAPDSRPRASRDRAAGAPGISAPAPSTLDPVSHAPTAVAQPSLPPEPVATSDSTALGRQVNDMQAHIAALTQQNAMILQALLGQQQQGHAHVQAHMQQHMQPVSGGGHPYGTTARMLLFSNTAHTPVTAIPSAAAPVSGALAATHTNAAAAAPFATTAPAAPDSAAATATPSSAGPASPFPFTFHGMPSPATGTAVTPVAIPGSSLAATSTAVSVPAASMTATSHAAAPAAVQLHTPGTLLQGMLAHVYDATPGTAGSRGSSQQASSTPESAPPAGASAAARLAHVLGTGTPLSAAVTADTLLRPAAFASGAGTPGMPPSSSTSVASVPPAVLPGHATVQAVHGAAVHPIISPVDLSQWPPSMHRFAPPSLRAAAAAAAAAGTTTSQAPAPPRLA